MQERRMAKVIMHIRVHVDAVERKFFSLKKAVL
jgi:hypothetical protein